MRQQARSRRRRERQAQRGRRFGGGGGGLVAVPSPASRRSRRRRAQFSPYREVHILPSAAPASTARRLLKSNSCMLPLFGNTCEAEIGTAQPPNVWHLLSPGAEKAGRRTGCSRPSSCTAQPAQRLASPNVRFAVRSTSRSSSCRRRWSAARSRSRPAHGTVGAEAGVEHRHLGAAALRCCPAWLVIDALAGVVEHAVCGGSTPSDRSGALPNSAQQIAMRSPEPAHRRRTGTAPAMARTAPARSSIRSSTVVTPAIAPIEAWLSSLYWFARPGGGSPAGSARRRSSAGSADCERSACRWASEIGRRPGRAGLSQSVQVTTWSDVAAP